MKAEMELKLQEDFPFMKQNRIEGEKNIYKKWGCECSNGWYQLIYDLCQAITDRYAKEDVPIDIVPEQIKEKFASLRFYYSFKDTSCSLQAIDCLNGFSIRFEPQNNDKNENIKNLRHDIREIVRAYEEKSKTICEFCGKDGILRTDMYWKKTLCDECYNSYLKQRNNTQNRQ